MPKSKKANDNASMLQNLLGSRLWKMVLLTSSLVISDHITLQLTLQHTSQNSNLGFYSTTFTRKVEVN